MTYKRSIFRNILGSTLLWLYCCVKIIISILTGYSLIGYIMYCVLGCLALTIIFRTLTAVIKYSSIIKNRKPLDSLDNLSKEDLIKIYKLNDLIYTPMDCIGFAIGFFISDSLFSLLFSVMQM